MSEKNEQELSKDEALKNTAESAMASKDAIKPAPADSIQFSVIFDDADGLDLEGADDATTMPPVISTASWPAPKAPRMSLRPQTPPPRTTRAQNSARQKRTLWLPQTPPPQRPSAMRTAQRDAEPG